MDLVIGTLILRPYVFIFLGIFLIAGALDLGWRRAVLFGAIVGPVAWLAEFSSTRTGVPFGLYHYTGLTRGREIYVADVPLMDAASFPFLAYAAFCLARRALAPWRPSRPTLALAAGLLMTALDVVIDPLAVRGDRWFLGRIFYYPAGGVYFGVPPSNFAGWALVGVVAVGFYLLVAGTHEGRRVWPGVALYYAVLAFNLAVTAWIREWTLVGVGATLHVGLALALLYVHAQARRVAGDLRTGEVNPV